jgi:hypothetical protein
LTAIHIGLRRISRKPRIACAARDHLQHSKRHHGPGQQGWSAAPLFRQSHIHLGPAGAAHSCHRPPHARTTRRADQRRNDLHRRDEGRRGAPNPGSGRLWQQFLEHLRVSAMSVADARIPSRSPPATLRRSATAILVTRHGRYWVCSGPCASARSRFGARRVIRDPSRPAAGR